MSPADGESEEQMLSDRAAYASSQANTPTLASTTTHTPSGPTTPSAASVPRIAETPPTAGTPGSGGSSSETSPFLPENNSNVTRDIRNTPRCSIPGGERGLVHHIHCDFI